MFMKNSHAVKSKQVVRDVYYTPATLVTRHLELLKPYVDRDDRLLDPFFGQGAYYNQFATMFPDNPKDYTEIEMGLDFFAYEQPVDVIVSNPPFSQLTRILEHSIDLKPKIISYLISIMNFTPPRLRLMNEHGYYLVAIHLTKVSSWFNNLLLCVFSNQVEPTDQIITFDPQTHKGKRGRSQSLL